MTGIVDQFVWLLLLVGGGVFAVLAPGWGLLARFRQWRRARERRKLEDALKHLLALSDRGQSASAESLVGALGLSQKELVELVARMESRGLLSSMSGGLVLTSEGERLALQIVRAHRLWERYLADEAGMAMTALHGAAEKAEHKLTLQRLDELDAQLGHPETDPHGDPIPRPDGSLSEIDATPLTDWESDGKAYISHIEDEPEIVFSQIAALGFQVGDSIRVLERGQGHLVVAHGDAEHRLAPVVSANIHVRARRLIPARPADSFTLAELPDGAEAEIVALDPHYRGFARRRLLDLGLTPGTRVKAELDNAFGDPKGYRVRGTLVALRNTQASLIWVRDLKTAERPAPEEVAAP